MDKITKIYAIINQLSKFALTNLYKMKVFNSKDALKGALKPLLEQKKTIGFVPTMGALHQGHLSLISRSLEQNQVTVLSIFVNPTQFNNLEDLEKYPRTLEKDVEKVHQLNPDVIIYAPSVADIYGENVVSEKFDYDGLEHQMEGKQRPGHFDGVGTILKRLFEIVTPTRAYFGEKDYQQTLIVKKMVEKISSPVEIIVCPILREESGLAMSSRNERLTPEQRQKASMIYQVLLEAKKLFETQTPEKVQEFVETTFNQDAEIDLEYFTIADSQTLLPIAHKQASSTYRAFIVVSLGNVRLIDTISLN